MKNDIFWIFGTLQAMTLGVILFIVLQTTGIGTDTNIVLSALFPICTLILEYLVYTKK